MTPWGASPSLPKTDFGAGDPSALEAEAGELEVPSFQGYPQQNQL